MRLLGRMWIVLVCAALLVACGSDDSGTAPETEATPPQAPLASPTPMAPTMEISAITWSESRDDDSGEPTEIVSVFTTQSPAIIAMIEVTDVPEGTEFSARWTINDQPIDGTEMDFTVSEDLDHGWIAFAFTRDDDQRYPIGQLGVVITSSEGDLREDSIEIGFP